MKTIEETMTIIHQETVLEGGWTTIWKTAWRCGKQMGILPHYFPRKEFKFYIQKEEDMWIM